MGRIVLAEPAFFILTALVGEPQYGYGIVGEVERLSEVGVALVHLGRGRRPGAWSPAGAPAATLVVAVPWALLAARALRRLPATLMKV